MRILLVTNAPPWPVSGGGLQRTNLLHRALSELGQVDLFLWNRPPEITAAAMARLDAEFGLIGCGRPAERGEKGLWRHLRPLHPRAIDRLAHHLGNHRVEYSADPRVVATLNARATPAAYDLVVGRYLISLTKAGLLDHPRSIVDLDDLPSSVYRTRAHARHVGPLARRVFLRHTHRLEALEQDLASRPAGLWVAKEEDRHVGGAGAAARVLPNICWHPPGHEPSPLPEHDGPHVVSIGNLGYPPNLEGVRLFCRHVWPRVRAEVPAAVYRIAGGGLTDAVRRELVQPGVEALGFIDNVRDVYRTSCFAVAPVYYGGGTNIKVVEALAHGRAAVVTRAAARGYEAHLANGAGLLVADDAAECAAHCVRLLREPSYRRQLAAAGHAAVKAHYSWDVFKTAVHDTVHDVLERRFRRRR